MQISNVIQGSGEWHALRAEKFNASEAPAMLGLSPYTTRNELLTQKATGIIPEVTPAKQILFDKGHAAEAAARPVIEKIIGDLFPVTGTLEVEGLELLASFDGITMLQDVTWENKMYSASAAKRMEGGVLPDQYWPQVEQQLLVSGADKTLFTISSGDPDETIQCWYESVPARRAQLIAGWKQFAEDLAKYEHIEVAAPAAAAAIKDLPAVSVTVSGDLAINDNFELFGVALQGFITDTLIRKPQTDQDFADLDSQIKTLKKAETALVTAGESMLAQISSVDALVKTKDMLHKLARDNRLMAEKLLEAEKLNRRNEILQKGKDSLAEHIKTINDRLGRVTLPVVDVDFAGALKGKRTITSLQSAADDELARAKLAANAISETISANLNVYDDHVEGYEFLFMDLQQLATKETDGFTAVVKLRISEHKEAEAEKQRKIDADAIVEQQRIAAEKLAEQQKAEPVATEQPAQETTPTEPQAEAAQTQPAASESAEPPAGLDYGNTGNGAAPPDYEVGYIANGPGDGRIKVIICNGPLTIETAEKLIDSLTKAVQHAKGEQ